MTDNEKLYLWQHNGQVAPWVLKSAPDYLNDEAAAVSLLMTAIRKGWYYRLEGSQRYFSCKLYKIPDTCEYREDGFEKNGKSFREAIVAACLEVARKEAQGE